MFVVVIASLTSHRVVSPLVSLIALRLSSVCCVLSSLSFASCRRSRIASHLVSSHLILPYHLTHQLIIAVPRTASSLIVASSLLPTAHRPTVGYCVRPLSHLVALRHVPSCVASLCCIALSSPTACPYHSRTLLLVCDDDAGVAGTSPAVIAARASALSIEVTSMMRPTMQLSCLLCCP